TQDLSYDKQVCVSSVYPCFTQIEENLRSFSSSIEFETMKVAFDEMGREPKRLAKKILLDCFERYLDENIDTEEIPITPSLMRPKSLAERMIATITNTSINNESEIDKYLKQPAIIFTEDIDILKWWNNNRKNFLILSGMAMDYLGIMPSSIPSERCFSIANLTIDKNRSNLAPDTVQELLCLKSKFKKKV
ncbi:zinc finger BED domain-containing RICESLEEPER 2-like, partial [Brachionus plicatilis]